MARLPKVPDGPRRSEFLPASGSPLLTLATVTVVMAALYVGRDIFIPLALAILLSFALAPAVKWLRRAFMPRVPAVMTVVLLAFLTISAFGAVVASQVADLAESLPFYQRNIEQKIDSLRGSFPGKGVIERASGMLKDISRQMAESRPEEGGEPGEAPARSAAAPESPPPLPVEVRQPEPGPMEVLRDVVGPLVEPLTTGGIVIVFVVFMLIQREDLRDRVIRLAGPRDLQRTTEALDDAGQRVAHYLLMHLLINVTYGIPVAIGLWLIGVPNPLLWGMLCIVLRFVPYIGPIVAAAFPLVLAVAVDPGWSMLLWAAGLFVVLEVVSNNILEPWLYGASTGLSPVAVIVAAIVWTWLWGPVGLLLSTPLTVCLVVLGRHVPQLAFLDVLLGSQPVLTPAETLYQRLLAGDPDEATERAEEFLEERPLAAFYDTVAIPALALAESDRAKGTLDQHRRALVADGALTLVDNLSEHEDVVPEPEAAEGEGQGVAPSPAPLPAGMLLPAELPPGWHHRPVLCVAGRGNLDLPPAAMLAQLLERRGIGTRVVPFEAIQPGALLRLEVEGVRMVCLSYMNPESAAHARYLVRRLRRILPDVSVLVGLWTFDIDAGGRDLLPATRADLVAATLEQAVEQVLAVAAKEKSTAAAAQASAPEPVPAPAKAAGA